MLCITTSTGDELLRNVNIDDLKWPWALKMLVFSDFWRFLPAKVNCNEMDGDRPRLPGNRKWYRLLRIFRTLSIDLKFSDGTLQFLAFLTEREKQARFTTKERDSWVAYGSSHKSVRLPNTGHFMFWGDITKPAVIIVCLDRLDQNSEFCLQ